MWKMKIEQIGTGRQWDEEITRQNPNTYKWNNIPKSSSKKKAMEYAESVVERFNNTLREGERARKVVGVFFDDN
ncbi:hypothetical protein [Bacillus thuringiensis]|uniref:hypothetical protein n=1 Tax=Bacillus thuringiensis TaxID=1428 RepID=UPI000A3AACC8|nr:hypothetical protein [Bacillus thuringiensis]OUA60377.1 hypothetical protein BK785_09455 [Bacillus thuringiensis serovar bolivia]OUA80050.1 hypothetical protein BK787_03620 [Bacillus thuringiensis serovar pahangi]